MCRVSELTPAWLNNWTGVAASAQGHTCRKTHVARPGATNAATGEPFVWQTQRKTQSSRVSSSQKGPGQLHYKLQPNEHYDTVPYAPAKPPPARRPAGPNNGNRPSAPRTAASTLQPLLFKPNPSQMHPVQPAIHPATQVQWDPTKIIGVKLNLNW